MLYRQKEMFIQTQQENIWEIVLKCMGMEGLAAKKAPNPSLFCLRISMASFPQALRLSPPHVLKVFHSPKIGRAQEPIEKLPSLSS